MAITTTTEIAGPVNVQFQVNLLRNAKAVAPYFIGTMPAEITSHGNTFTAKWRRYENLTPVTSALSELTGGLSFPTRTGVQPTVTDVTSTVQKFGNFIILSEEVDLININAQAAKLTEILGINAGQSLNRLQRNVAEDNLTAFLSGTATTATDINTANYSVSDNTNLVNVLQRNDALKFRPRTEGSTFIGTQPIRDAFWVIGHVDWEEDVRELSGFRSIETYSSQTETALGEFGALGSGRLISTSEGGIDLATGVAVTGTATASARSAGGVRYDVYNTVMYGMDCLGSLGLDATYLSEVYRVGDTLPPVMMIMNAKGSAGSADPLHEVATMGWKSWHAGQVLNGTWGRVARHSASKLNTE